MGLFIEGVAPVSSNAIVYIPGTNKKKAQADLAFYNTLLEKNEKELKAAMENKTLSVEEKEAKIKKLEQIGRDIRQGIANTNSFYENCATKQR